MPSKVSKYIIQAGLDTPAKSTLLINAAMQALKSPFTNISIHANVLYWTFWTFVLYGN